MADVPHYCTGIHVGDAYEAFFFEIVLDIVVSLVAGILNGEVFANEAGNFDAARLYFTGFGAVVANVCIGGHQQLTEVGRICKNFLVARHSGVETNFASGGANFSGSLPVVNGTIFQ